MGEIFAGRYELVDPVGHGGVGAVWRAWDRRRRRYVAAKVLQQSDAHTLLRFVREQALRIDHPHVLAPRSWAADDDKVLFTMDLVRGGSLAHLVADYGPLPPHLVCVLLDQLLAGLTAVHAEGVVHRDIKPANLLLEATGTGRPHLRLSDFGIAMRKGEPRLTEANYVVGTPGYFAPEQMLGDDPDFPADLFAVGLVALCLLTGSNPDAQALIERFAHEGTPPAPQEVPEPLWQVLATLLQPDPRHRFRTAIGARKALLAAAELLPDATVEDEIVEVFDHIGPLPTGFGPDGPVGRGGHRGPAAVEESQESHPSPSGAPLGGAAPGSAPAPAEGNGPGFPVGAPQGAVGAGHGGLVVPSGINAGHAGAVDPNAGRADTGSPGAHTSYGDSPAHRHVPPAPYGNASPTGSFHLAPPAAAPPTPQTPPPPLPTASGTAPHTTTRPYTSGHPPLPAHVPGPAAESPEPRRLAGPPAKVAVPVLIVALLCIAAGIWALNVS
ncbi:serine/threonine-protein kinase [Streptomyces sp. NPDC003077]|uniref:serine/threonine protein kinase n=1 Tax=Streptomyces sp. NPDC003077 TaxID=3154443 RepID=UPI0033AC2E96